MSRCGKTVLRLPESIPRVNNIQTTVHEVYSIACREFCTSRLGNGRNRRSGVADRSAESAAVSSNLRKNSGRVALEAENTAREILGKHSVRRRKQSLTTFALRQQLNAIKDLGLCNGRREEFRCWLSRNPRCNRR